MLQVCPPSVVTSSADEAHRLILILWIGNADRNVGGTQVCYDELTKQSGTVRAG